jgi:predicted AlkP superfamily pyrophosphatase or phosphodiesterase
MRRDDHADALVADLDEDGYLFPDYGGYCIAGMLGATLSVHDARPQSVPTLPEDVFAGVEAGDIEQVVFLLVDGFGYDQWRRFEQRDRLDTDLLGAISTAGTVTPLTSVFPSETAAALPTILTGQHPIEHGLLGWWKHLEGVGRIKTLPYETVDDRPVREAHPDAPQPYDVLYSAEPLGPKVTGVDSALYTPAGQASDHPHTFGMVADAYRSYETIPQLGVQLRRALESGTDQLYAYLPEVDSASHRDGPDGPETEMQVEAILAAVRRQLCDRLDPAVADQTLLVVSADHGHLDTSGDNIDISDYDPLWDALERVDGEPIPPMGGARQLQLHLQAGTVPEVSAALEGAFDCRTFTRAEYERRNLFGPGEQSPAADLPDLVCVHRNRGMWDLQGQLDHVGVHGGLHRAEMLVPFAVARLSALG